MHSFNPPVKKKMLATEIIVAVFYVFMVGFIYYVSKILYKNDINSEHLLQNRK